MPAVPAVTSPFPEALLAQLRGRFRTRAAETIELIAQFLQAPSAASASPLHEAIHKLAGIASTLGYDEAGALALALDGQDLPIPPDAACQGLLERLRQALARAVEEGETP